MDLSQEKFNKILQLLNQKYPNWSLSNPQFVEQEINYKRATASKAHQLLGLEQFRSLLNSQNYEELCNRLDRIGKDNNLLFKGVPKAGDLNILYSENLDKKSFCEAAFDLLWGNKNTIDRLKSWFEYVTNNNLPNKWTFPTYFLFFLHPESEMFVKPGAFKWFLSFAGYPELWPSEPSAETYLKILDLCNSLKQKLSTYRPQDMIDVQSVLWVAKHISESTQILETRVPQVIQLWKEFVESYPNSEKGQEHFAGYKRGRVEAKDNFQLLSGLADNKQDLTDSILSKTLPHQNTENNRQTHKWIHVAPAITKDAKQLFEGSGNVKAEEWARTSQGLWNFFKRCIQQPEELKEACKEFSESPYSKGFQAGMLTPFLNALRPEDFMIVNAKSRKLLEYLTGKGTSSKIADYPETNQLAKQVVDEMRSDHDLLTLPDVLSCDAFDAFSHWLIAIKNFSLESVTYYKLAPGENARKWQEWLDGGHASIGWGDLGNIAGLSKKEFNERLDEAIQKRPGFKKGGMRQVWEFSRIQEGDRIVANQGTSKVLGIGTVIGPYYYAEGEEHPHRLPVRWDDTTPKSVVQPSWFRSLIKLDEEEFAKILGAQSAQDTSPQLMVREASGDEPLFKREAFQLLEELHKNPRSEFYTQHKKEFVEFVEEPLERLMRSVAAAMPETMKIGLETEKKIMSRFIKNDYGKGGAWDYLWAAFYPKGSKRINSAQLFAWINRNHLDFGFTLGAYVGEDYKRFLRNLDLHRPSVAFILNSQDGSELSCGVQLDILDDPSTKPLTIDEWLKDPSSRRSDVFHTLRKNQVLQMNIHDLTDEIVKTFSTVFPLFLLAARENPALELEKFTEAIEEVEEPEENPEYSITQCSQDTGISTETLETWLRAIRRKGQAVLYGPPGTGKTYVAEKLAQHLIAGGDGIKDIVQFHPGYAYEDFIQGIRPKQSDKGLDFPLEPGRFFKFCTEAASKKGSCVFIIDEINRADLSKVFGELMYLLEYRDENISLAGGRVLSIPKNVLILGTMNTADRSIALVDHALRRRFAFIRLEPLHPVLIRYHENNQTGFPVGQLVDVLNHVNREINDTNYQIGISYFLMPKLAEEIQSIWRMEIEPYLEEIFYGQREKVEQFRWDKVKSRIFGGTS